MTSSNKSLAYALLRLTMGINFAGHGIIRLTVVGLSQFAHGTAEHLTKSPLSISFMVAFLYVVPIIEALVGIALIFGIFTRVALVTGALLIAALTLGVTANQQWDTAGLQLTYALIVFVLLFLLEYNTLSVDGMRRR
jgi:thiosulfate dehydrogenase (quinone) large subunit